MFGKEVKKNTDTGDKPVLWWQSGICYSDYSFNKHLLLADPTDILKIWWSLHLSREQPEGRQNSAYESEQLGGVPTAMGFQKGEGGKFWQAGAIKVGVTEAWQPT